MAQKLEYVRGAVSSAGMTVKFTDREAAAVKTLDHARFGAVEADETDPTENPFGTKILGEKLLIPEPILQSQDHRLLA